MEWSNRIVGDGQESPEQLLANPFNFRRHPKEQIDALEGILDEVGWVQRIIVNKATGHLIDGHARVELAIRRQEAAVPVIYVDLTEREERLVLATFDPISGLAYRDDDILRDLLAGIEVENEAVKAFLAQVKTDIIVPSTWNTDPDDVPPIETEAISKLGDIWLLGKHRIMCGDSTSANHVNALLVGGVPHLMVTDPPYGVEYDPTRTSDNPMKAGKVLNDDRADWREAWALFPGDVAYVWHASMYTHVVLESLEACGFEHRAMIVWGKDRFTLGRGHYHWQHEPAWYVVKKGATGHWASDRKQTTLWSIPAREDDGHGHGTQKPIECMRRPIENNSKPGDAIYDPFSGSGTTIIAAEQTDRCCYAMELFPQYVDVAIRRWQQFTGKKAIHATTGEQFPEQVKDG